MDSQRIISRQCEADEVRAAKRHQDAVLFARISSLADEIAFAIMKQKPLEDIRGALTLLALEISRVNEFSLWFDHELSGAKPQ